ncbi:IMP dehydrogenase [Puniceicoccaceae bacterium K14]|nr:IMP dehydrogenase [Puniceicoccaceae bacterium K14]
MASFGLDDFNENEFYKSSDEFFHAQRDIALTYDDVSLATNYSEILPRFANLQTSLSDSLELQIPIISSDMDTVTEYDMAIAMALNGGMGIIHYNMPLREQVSQVTRVKYHINGLLTNPITISDSVYIADVLKLIEEKGYKFRTFPVIQENGKLAGLLNKRVVKERYRHLSVQEAMTPLSEVFTIKEKDIASNPIDTADKFFNDHIGINKLIVVDDSNNLKGLIALSDIERIIEDSHSTQKAARDSDFRLVVGAAISTVWKSDGTLDRDAIVDHVSNLVSEKVNAIAVSTAHGHSKGVGETVKLLRSKFKDLTLIAGNVTSASGVEYLADCGANAIKIGQGPGSICTTRIVAGVGIPQLSALHVASQGAKKKGVRIIADGGITKSGDMVKALTQSDAVILGSMLAGSREAPGEIIEINGKLYKQYRGMGSLSAMKKGSAARYGHDKKDKTRKFTAEGVEGMKEVRGPVANLLAEYAGGIQSGMGYLGAANLTDLKKNARFVRISPAGMKESAPHDVIEIAKRG